MPGNASGIPYAHMLCTPVWPLPSLQFDVILSTSTNHPPFQPLPARYLHGGRGQAAVQRHGKNLPKSSCSLIPQPMYQRGAGKSIFPLKTFLASYTVD